MGVTLVLSNGNDQAEFLLAAPLGKKARGCLIRSHDDFDIASEHGFDQRGPFAVRVDGVTQYTEDVLRMFIECSLDIVAEPFVGVLHFFQQMQAGARCGAIMPHVGEGIRDGVVSLAQIGGIIIVAAQVVFGRIDLGSDGFQRRSM